MSTLDTLALLRIASTTALPWLISGWLIALFGVIVSTGWPRARRRRNQHSA